MSLEPEIILTHGTTPLSNFAVTAFCIKKTAPTVHLIVCATFTPLPPTIEKIRGKSSNLPSPATPKYFSSHCLHGTGHYDPLHTGATYSLFKHSRNISYITRLRWEKIITLIYLFPVRKNKEDIKRLITFVQLAKDLLAVTLERCPFQKCAPHPLRVRPSAL